MKAIFLAFALSATWLLAPPAMAQDAAPIKTTKHKTSYSAGAKVAEHFQNGKTLINIEVFIRGLRDGFAGKGLAMDESEIESVFAALEEKLRAYEKVKEDGEKFLAKNARAEGVVVLPSGVQYKILRAGSGESPTSRNRIKAHYSITLVDGTVFFSSYERDEPGDIGVNQVVPGLEEALQLMSVGSKWKVFIPANLGYGARGSGTKVPPNSALIIEMELFEILPEVAVIV